MAQCFLQRAGNNIHKKLLWTNPNWEADFVAKKINIDLTNYDYLMINYYQSNQNNSWVGSVLFDLKITNRLGHNVNNTFTFPLGVYAGLGNYYNRPIAIEKDKQSIFVKNVVSLGEGVPSENGRCIPYQIYGVKGEIK